ncbi:6289_t:CDS:1, partial [Gigaspora rosea]
LVKNYPNASDYLIRNLDPYKSAWAKAFTLNIFNSEIQFSQRAKTTNSVIKRQLNYQNISIYDLFMELEERLATKNINSTFIDWKM